MLERSLHFPYIPCAITHINVLILWVLDTESHSLPLVTIGLPASLLLPEIEAALPHRYAELFVVEEGAVHLEEVDQVLAEVYLVSVAPSVTPLEVIGDKHGQQKATDSSMISLIQLATFKEAFEDNKQGS